MTIAFQLDPPDQERLARLAAARGESVEQTARSLLVTHLQALDWPEDREEDWARGSVSMAAKFLPPEDWGAGASDGSR